MSTIPWAKLARRCTEGRGARCRKSCSCSVIGWLSVIGHAADVAAVFFALLELPVVAGRLAQLFGKGRLTQTDCARLLALTALHDLGKINVGFQNRRDAASAFTAGHVAPAVALLRSQKVFRTLMADGKLDRLSGCIDDHRHDCDPLLTVLAHHGSLPDPGNCTCDPKLWRERGEYDPVTSCRALVAAIEVMGGDGIWQHDRADRWLVVRSRCACLRRLGDAGRPAGLRYRRIPACRR